MTHYGGTLWLFVDEESTWSSLHCIKKDGSVRQAVDRREPRLPIEHSVLQFETTHRWLRRRREYRDSAGGQEKLGGCFLRSEYASSAELSDPDRDKFRMGCGVLRQQ